LSADSDQKTDDGMAVPIVPMTAKAKGPRSSAFYAEIGRKGGLSRKAQQPDYQALGRKGGESRKAQGVDYRALGRKGGESVRTQRGSRFYAEIGRKGGEARIDRLKDQLAPE